ncbi:GMC oxidoreductase [Podospora appendiculata]|uniref:GMC oxidoreductase n=1 Tax=Podospora appendiculata TaxID=314037 RepID=A0AAE1CH64_9PEZI|nr:GMC oxidoreductase [Podospora appendiculata]
MFHSSFASSVLGLLALAATVLGKAPCALVFDYIIVGGGTGGNALATRLSQGLPGSKILVIEAGPAAPDELGINVPGRKGSTLTGKYDWNFSTVAQAQLGGRVLRVARGKVLGGSSALNLLVWDRAAKAEYDAWEQVGNPGWNFASMMAAMTKAENYTGGPVGSGTHGPVHAVVNPIVPVHEQEFVPTVSEVFGIPENKDSIRGVPIGVMLQPKSIDPANWNRSYSANSYLPEAGANLQILTDTQVARVNFAKRGSLLRATGVTLANGSIIYARREVVLSAGSIQTPTLLELSGIGQASVLGAANITQLVDLPGVGESYQDHLRVQVSFQLKDNYSSIDVLKYNTTAVTVELNKWLAGEVSLYDDVAGGILFANWAQLLGTEGAGALAALAHDTAAGLGWGDVGTRKKLEQLADPTIPQVEIIFSDGYTGVKGYPAVGAPLRGKSFFTLIAGLMHPLSRGSVHINATDPRGSNLVIDPRFLDNEYDIQALVGIIKFCRRIAHAEPLRSVWVAEYEPGADAVQTDVEWRSYVLNSVLSIYHPMGTAAMLPRADGGVVDARLRVHGTANLRVVDASVIPVQISAHIQTAVYGIAERAAEIMIAAAASTG